MAREKPHSFTCEPASPLARLTQTRSCHTILNQRRLYSITCYHVPIPSSSSKSVRMQRASVRPTVASFRQAFARRFASTENKSAAESASKAYEAALGNAKRIGGPITEKIGNMLGSKSGVFRFMVKVLITSCCDSYQATRNLLFSTSRSLLLCSVRSTLPKSWLSLRIFILGPKPTARSSPRHSLKSTGSLFCRVESGPSWAST